MTPRTIQEFLDWKDSPEHQNWRKTHPDFEGVPMGLIDTEGRYFDIKVMDAKASQADTELYQYHELEILFELDGDLKKVIQRCRAPIGCKIDWSKVICAWNILI